MNRTFEYLVTNEYEGITVGEYLKKQGYSRQILIHLKKTKESILKNKVWCYVNELLLEGDVLTIKVIENQSSPNIVPVSMPLSIVYEDADIMVVNKDQDMPVHPSQGNFDNTLANGILYYFSNQGIPYVFRCITRLDRDTTGLLLIAKNMVSAAILSNMMVNREIHRTYLAIAKGKVPKEGRIEAPIGRVEGSTIERKVDFVSGETAITNYTCVGYTKDYSLVKLKLETGRTHQIRVHMAHLGYPLIGDFIYGPDFTHMKRQALHSYKLSFVHPITKKPFTFTCDLPEDMKIAFN